MLQKDIWICLIVISYPILVITLAYFANVAKNELEQVKKLKDKINRLEIQLGAREMENEDFRSYLSEIYSKASIEKLGTPWDKEYIAAIAKQALEKNKNEERRNTKRNRKDTATSSRNEENATRMWVQEVET